ncbi:ATP-dependent serine protease [Burkholderia sp. Nafp2/4-1b]|uniref:ATP-dependent serine protease n=1 Tax=Burkholderia sp. Nafp2/4-1b TaxID=2116686 RepID=UPI000EF89560|nr:ATP-dependent serine protease [Burkholderia sp. Nafp2/4-1b]RKU04655.1 ATP-dependent serine protease [Burkholderia sp. Nafp2/4-1b]
MRVLLSQRVRPRDTLRGVLNQRVESRDAISQRCRQCGFMAFRATEQCPVCGLGDWPFMRLDNRSGEARSSHAAHPPHSEQPVPNWSSRIAAAVRGAAIRRPRPSSAPLLSILTVVLLVGGYVTFDRTCRSDPVCRGQGAPGPATIDAGVHPVNAPTVGVAPAQAYALQRSDAPTAPVVRAPADALQPSDDTQVAVAAAQPRDTDTGTSRRASGRATGGHATTTLARHAPPAREPASARSGIRVADWKGGVPARRPHAVRRVSAHAHHGRRAAATETQLADLYRGH